MADLRGRRRTSHHDIAGALRRNVALIVIGALVGGALGMLLASLRSDYESTVVLSVRSSGDASATATAVQSAAVLAVSDAVIRQAAGALGVDPGTLASRASASGVDGTNLLNLTATGGSPAEATAAVRAVSDALVASYQSRSTEIAQRIRTAGEELLKSGGLSAAAAEIARQNSIGETVGAAQGGAVDGAVAVTPVAEPTTPRSTGVSRSVGAVFGAAAGVLLAALVALSRGWQLRRRVGSSGDLDAVPGTRVAATARDADDVAGVVLESGRRTVVVLDATQHPAESEAFQRDLCAALRTRGQSVARVLVASAPVPVTSGGSGTPARMVAALDAEAVLARPAREKLAVELGCDIAVVSAPYDLPATHLLHGQEDHLPVVLFSPGMRQGDVEAALAPFTAAGPVAVLLD